MTDTPGLPSAIGIEAVELVSEGGAGVTLRVTGRWRRRRPEWVGPAMLVVEVEGRRQRIPAMPEPPSLTGTLPGTWRMSFSVPAELVGSLEGRTWLQLGAVMAPLSLPPRGDAGSRPAIDPELLAERELLSYEFAVESARRRAREADLRVTQLEGEVGRLEAELEEVRREPERLWAGIGERERALRLARQQVHAETMLREELEARLGEQERAMERLRERARRLGERERELEGGLRRARREADEARHAAAAARTVAAAVPAEAVAGAAVEPAPVGVARPPRGRPPDRGRGLADEVGLAKAVLSAASAPRAAPITALPGRLSDVLGAELVLLAPRLSPRRAAVSLPARAPEPPPLPGEAPPVAPEPAPVEPPGELTAAIRTLEAELESTRAALALERDAARAELAQAQEARAAAEARIAVLEEDLARQRERSARALRLIVDFRRELEELRAPRVSVVPAAETVPAPVPPAAPVPEPEAAAVPEPEAAPEAPATQPEEPSVEPSRLSAALERLREQHPPDAAGGPATGTGPAGELPGNASDAVPRLFRILLREDPAAAGRLVIGLLPAQRLVDPRPVAYDLVLGPETCLRVTVGSGAPEIELTATPRPAASTQFRIEGDPASLARLLGAGSLRRRLGWGGRMARPTGDKGTVAALRALTNTPLRPRQLREAGVELEPSLVLRLVAVLAGAEPLASPFTLAHRTPAGDTTATLHVQPGGHAAVTATGLEPSAGTTVTCPPPRLLDALLGDRSGDVEVEGDERPLALVRQWLERA